MNDKKIQDSVRSWWQSHPMTYDWHGTTPYSEDSREYFEEIDRRFFNRAASYFAHTPDQVPFSHLIPFGKLDGKRVLEVGCGSGAHARLIAQADAELTAIDLTERSVQLTKRRLALWDLEGQVLLMDAENLAFPDGYFDFVWSWGVIHHSARTERAVAEIARVLKREAEARIMVYHRHSIVAMTYIIRALLSGRLFSMSFDDALNYYSDGYLARHYTAHQFSEVLAPYFSSIQIQVFGQKSDMFPLPGVGALGAVKSLLVALTPEPVIDQILKRWGYFLFIIARR